MNGNAENDLWIIGIDPDLQKSGVAELKVGAKLSTIIVRNLFLWSLLDALGKEKERIKCVYIEAGWLNKAGLTFGGLCRARDAGMNHAIGKQIELYCRENGVPYRLVRPSTGKWTHDQFVRYTGCTEYRKTNQEQRDAARLITGI